MKKLLLLIILLGGGLYLPLIVQAVAGTYEATSTSLGKTVTICYEGFVPCGTGKQIWENGYIDDNHCNGTLIKDGINCQFCHLFIMLNRIISFVLINIVPYLAILMLVIGGIMFYFGGGMPNLLTQGKSLIKGVIIGLFLIYGSYMIIGSFLFVLGVTNIQSLVDWSNQGPFIINCEIKI